MKKRTVTKELSRLGAAVLSAVVCLSALQSVSALSAFGDGFIRHGAEFDYIIGSDDTVSLAKYTGSAETVDVPSEIDGRTVTELYTTGDPYETELFQGVFADNAAVRSVSLPDTVEIVCDGSFKNCTSLESVVLGSRVRYIGGGAFSNTALQSVALPASVKVVGTGAFGGTGRLTRIEVDEENDVFTSVDGVLYSKDMERLIAVPSGRAGELTIPDGVTDVDKSAFLDCDKLERVTLPEGITRIPAYFMEKCAALEEAVIPASVTSIGTGAFSGCDKLTLYGQNGSAAESYARENGIPFSSFGGAAVVGDLDRDGVLTSSDALAVLRISTGLQAAGADAFVDMDIDGDGQITSSDALAILRVCLSE